MAAYHNVGVLAFEVLTELPHLCPADVLLDWQLLARVHSARVLALRAQLRLLENAFRQQGIPLLVMKGPAIARFYRQPSLRAYGDLDLLVQPEDVSRARSVLINTGFCTTESEHTMKSRMYLTLASEAGFFSKNTGVCVDLHWSLDYPLNRYRHIFGLAQKSKIEEGLTMLSFPVEMTLVLYLFNGWRDHWRSLSLSVDIAQILERCPNIDWNRVFELASELHIERIVLLGLEVVRRTTRIVLPSEASRRILQEHTIERLASTAFDQVALRLPDVGLALPYHAAISWYAQSRDSLWDSLSQIWYMSCAPKLEDWEKLPLPSFFLMCTWSLLTKPFPIVGKALARRVMGSPRLLPSDQACPYAKWTVHDVINAGNKELSRALKVASQNP